MGEYPSVFFWDLTDAVRRNKNKTQVRASLVDV